MAKSRDAFRTISEVSDWLDTPAHVLRFWESRFSQIKPVKRAGGRRYYRPNDMLLLGGIKRLLHDDGITIKGVQKILREKGLKYVSSLSLESIDGPQAQAEPVETTEETPIEAILDSDAVVPPLVEVEPEGGIDDDPEQISETATETSAEDAVADAPTQFVAEAVEETIAQPDEPIPESADDPAQAAFDDADNTVETTPDNRLIALYQRLEALRNKVQMQMEAA